jgi:hypothetical protein
MQEQPVQLTITKLSLYGNTYISAVATRSRREAIAPTEEMPYFIKDCAATWNANEFTSDRSFIATMPADDWQSWLEMYEVDDQLAEQVIESLCA